MVHASGLDNVKLITNAVLIKNALVEDVLTDAQMFCVQLEQYANQGSV